MNLSYQRQFDELSGGPRGYLIGFCLEAGLGGEIDLSPG